MRYTENIRERRKLDENQRGGINKSYTRSRERKEGGGGADTARARYCHRQEEESLVELAQPVASFCREVRRHAPRLIRLSVFTYHRPLSVSSAFIIEANDLLSSPAPR